MVIGAPEGINGERIYKPADSVILIAVHEKYLYFICTNKIEILSLRHLSNHVLKELRRRHLVSSLAFYITLYFCNQFIRGMNEPSVTGHPFIVFFKFLLRLMRIHGYKGCPKQHIIFPYILKKYPECFAVIKIRPIFAATNSATLPADQRTRAELLFYIPQWNILNSQLTFPGSWNF
jgi:hypothetical protein